MLTVAGTALFLARCARHACSCDVPNAAFYWFAYEKLRASVMEQQTATLIATTSGLAAIAGAVSGAATTPIDVLKTRLQLLKPRQAGIGLGSACINVVRAGTFYRRRLAGMQQGSPVVCHNCERLGSKLMF